MLIDPLKKSLLTNDYFWDGVIDCSSETSEIVGGNLESLYLYIL